MTKARTVEDAEKIRQQVKALEALSKEFKLSREIQVDATELRIRAERRLGKILRGMEKKQGGNYSEQTKELQSLGVTTTPTLSDLGITKNESSKFQRLAIIDE